MPAQTRTRGRIDHRDARLLIQFLLTLEQVLDVTITTEGTFIPAQFQQSFRAGWREVRPTVRQLVRIIQTHKFDTKLRANGLSGSQLAMKMAVYQDALEKIQSFFSQYAPETLAPQEQSLAARPKESFTQKARKRGRELLQYFFKPANVVLGSMAKAIPLAELLHELKGTVETALDHTDLHEAIDKEKAAKTPAKEWAQWTQAATALALIAFTLTKQKPPAKS